MYRTIHLGPAGCALDLGDGSERGEYVDQDYILNVLGRPHRMVNIMYTYYPKDEQWPARISEACSDMKVGFLWDYPYDDYPPFCEGGPQYDQMRDIRRHGQDVMLTITMDCSLDDEHIRNIARKLKVYGRMFLRINHECNGDWFTHNRRFSYEEVAAFFVRAAGIIRQEAPNVRIVFCAGLADEDSDGAGAEDVRVQCEDVFADAYRTADVWSADKYLALNYGWPYEVAEVGGTKYTSDDPAKLFDRYKRTYDRLSQLFGAKPFIQAELNADADVTGPLHQGEKVCAYYDMVKTAKASWLTGISMYQFRDRGRLGLEIEDPNNSSVGIRQPLMDDYKKILSDPYFMPGIEPGDEASFPVTLRWGGSEDADGIEIELAFDNTPEFCEVSFEDDLSLMIELNGRWFYKSPGVSDVDLMPAFFADRFSHKRIIPLRIFATPPDGENHENGRDDWMTDQYYVLNKMPEMRIRYITPASGV
ncbi:MAG: hypothetical protein K6E49_06715 [Lachnospiraceae bacterium]|nr:hypothetical protein [Lachnospiraceae bacterium]